MRRRRLAAALTTHLQSARPHAWCRCSPLTWPHSLPQEMSDCRLGHAFRGTNASDCAYPAEDLSWVNIRLGI